MAWKLEDKKLGYGKILKNMDSGSYNFFGKEMHKMAEGFVFEEKDVKEFIERVKKEINDFAIHKTGVHKGFLCNQIDKLYGDVNSWVEE